MSSPTARLVALALQQRDQICNALRADQHCPETQAAIKKWHIEGGWFPAGRVTNLLAEWQPRYGYGPFQQLFQEAAHEVAAAGLGAYFLPKLERVRNAHDGLLEEARAVYEGDKRDLFTLAGIIHPSVPSG